MFVHELWKNADPSRLALDGNRALTYAQLSDQVRMVRNVLYKKGIRRKDRVALYSANSVEFVVVYMAVVSLGAIIIPVKMCIRDRSLREPGGWNHPRFSYHWSCREVHPRKIRRCESGGAGIPVRI